MTPIASATQNNEITSANRTEDRFSYKKPASNKIMVAISIIILVGLLNTITCAEAKDHHAIWEPGPPPEDPFVACFNACYDADAHPLAKLLCELWCAIYAKE